MLVVGSSRNNQQQHQLPNSNSKNLIANSTSKQQQEKNRSHDSNIKREIATERRKRKEKKRATSKQKNMPVVYIPTAAVVPGAMYTKKGYTYCINSTYQASSIVRSTFHSTQQYISNVQKHQTWPRKTNEN